MVQLVVSIWVCILLIYFVLFFHESGHTFFALIFTKHDVEIRLGGSLDKKHLKIGRLTIYLNGFSPTYGTVRFNDESLSTIKRALIFLGGPIFSLFLSFVLWKVIRNNIFPYIDKSLLKYIFLWSLWQFIVTIFPMKYTKSWGEYEGMSSDGLHAFNILFKTTKH